MKISRDAQAVIVRKTGTNEVSFLLIKRFDKDKQEDHYRLVKGGVEDDETSEEAAKRETFEEVGIKEIDTVELLDSYEYMGGEVKHEVEVYLLTTSSTEDNLKTDSSNEGGFTIKKAVWLNRDEAISKLNFADEKRMLEKASEKLN
jgi:8-oxo-dGTP pyrophosphatase MutT (NUDIX family)